MATGSARGPPPSSTTLPETKTGCSEAAGGEGVLGVELDRLEALGVPDFCAGAACTRRETASSVHMRCRHEKENIFALRSLCGYCLSPEYSKAIRGNRAILRLNSFPVVQNDDRPTGSVRIREPGRSPVDRRAIVRCEITRQSSPAEPKEPSWPDTRFRYAPI